jgi:NADPH-dependent ferric siderophore reductase
VLTQGLVRPSYRPYRVAVAATERLSPTFVRVTFTGPDLDVFGTDGLDQRIKLLLPLPGGTFTDFGADDSDVLDRGTWYSNWRALPDSARNPLRTYTVRRIDADARELVVDFALHGETGPASSWVTRAVPGDPLIIVGPDSRSPRSRDGIEFKPGAATRLLFAGDETAVPAISAILESLPDSVLAHAILEVPRHEDRLDIEIHSRVSVQWLAREGREAGALLAPAVRDWYAAECAPAGRVLPPVPVVDGTADSIRDSADELLWETPLEDPHEGLYAWIAGESSMVKQIRRYLVRDCGIDRSQVAFMGYWRAGIPEAG